MLLKPRGTICTGRPSQVNRSATYIVDLKTLDHPDDAKVDDYGKWNYSGSHVHYFQAESILEADDDDDNDDLEFVRVTADTREDNIYKLRRIHCKHPSNPNFLIAFLTGELYM